MRKSIEFYLQNGNIEDLLEILEMSEDCLWFIDKTFRLLAFNKMYVKHMQMFANVTPNIGDRDIVLACFPKDFSDNILKMYRRAFAGETVKSIDKGFNEDGTETDVIMIFKPVFANDNSIIGVTCSRRDISEYLKLKKQLEEKDNKIAKISWEQSHLYRGPLSTAMGIVNLLMDEKYSKHLSEDEFKELIIAVKEKLFELDQVAHSITKQADEKH